MTEEYNNNSNKSNGHINGHVKLTSAVETTNGHCPLSEKRHDSNGNLLSEFQLRRREIQLEKLLAHGGHKAKEGVTEKDESATESEDSEDEEDGPSWSKAPAIVTPYGTIESDPVPPKYQGRGLLVMLWFVYPLCFILTPLPDRRVFIYTSILWYAQMIGVLVGFHRYYAHRSYKAVIPWQIFIGFLGCTSGQKGPIFWSSQHRWHHKYCEKKKDCHSPYRFGKLDNPLKWLRGFFWAQGFYLWQHGPPRIHPTLVKDLVDDAVAVRLEIAATAIHWGTGLACWLWGGFQFTVWVFMLSTVLSWNAVQFVNSFSHICGSRDFECKVSPICNSRNVWWLFGAILGDNWHNNHHAFMSSVRHGFFWYEIDLNYYLIYAASLVGLTYDLRYPDVKKLNRFVPIKDNSAAG